MESIEKVYALALHLKRDLVHRQRDIDVIGAYGRENKTRGGHTAAGADHSAGEKTEQSPRVCLTFSPTRSLIGY
ncbi:hypothetical protein WN51_05697 [Melipona quadrifasciata]|uniref:Uncharacterized protein n=1 Tax=Melipona quadrifasciata TaxID=166423 RepID=A0A0M9ABC9_9HYME|nr:hypothetical protein WN51_05697 [Melipona quadrifasciata]